MRYSSTKPIQSVFWSQCAMKWEILDQECTPIRFIWLIDLWSFELNVAVDIISAIEFDKTGEHLATGDRGGRVVLFERTDGRDVSCGVTLYLWMFSTCKIGSIQLQLTSRYFSAQITWSSISMLSSEFRALSWRVSLNAHLNGKLFGSNVHVFGTQSCTTIRGGERMPDHLCRGDGQTHCALVYLLMCVWLFLLHCKLNFHCVALEQQRARRESERADYPVARHPEYRYATEFQSHEPEVRFTNGQRLRDNV